LYGAVTWVGLDLSRYPFHLGKGDLGPLFPVLFLDRPLREMSDAMFDGSRNCRLGFLLLLGRIENLSQLFAGLWTIPGDPPRTNGESLKRNNATKALKQQPLEITGIMS